METPLSTRRMTRSQARAQALAPLNSSTKNISNNSENNDSNIPFSRKLESESESAFSKSRTRSSKQPQQQQDRSALFDITNDSPIIGLAMESLETPSSAIAKQKSNRARAALTPGSGEALLRGQVKTLLQRVEEEADLPKLSMESRPFLHLKGLVSSPMGLLAPTPANTPQISNLSESGDEVNSNGMASITPSLPVIEEQLKICQLVAHIFNGSKPESLESQKSLNRSLLLDFSEKSEITDSSDSFSSVVTDQGGLGGGSVCKDKSSFIDDDNASVWSIQANASSTRDEEEEEVIEQEDDDEFYYHDDNEEEGEVEEEGEDGGLLDELCEGISKISVNDKALPKFSGKHTRFVYNSDDDEIVDLVGLSPSVLRLKGLPTPKGKHLRFPMEGDDN
ncbi:hypothetical protein HS088_TW14G00084 [Tripterygium wilfordii]|uniref:Chalcone-flavanone isomerase family protein n=1 Tax=Tripterygium wilfordii TaxID=458696 RepID=A0A7J7CPG2_TRIWF|nr:uncharacterized protein LOC120015774 [Tripterygium wilfordii]KAF5735954.1 hypothetical protein HS088_TW14G00084 [Tripterygium wilfordii]